MKDWLRPVRQALARRTSPIELFVRDDDVGWAQGRLFELLDLFETHALPIDLAVIPQALDQRLADDLIERALRSAGRIGVHQHGYSHRNHESVGRKCEFGPSRPQDLQYADIAAGRERLVSHLGELAEPCFTPPWNRCTQATVDALHRLGFLRLSRDTTASALERRGLDEVPVSLDWLKQRAGVLLAKGDLACDLAEQLGGTGPIGIMLHHERMDGVQRRRLAELLTCLRRSGQVRFVNLRQLPGHRGR